MKILHLSDLHFGYDSDSTKKVQRENLLNKLIEKTTGKNIETVFITGDIVWQCKEQGYTEANVWLKKLSKNINVPLDKFVICAGNHDVDHSECSELSYIVEQKRINESLKIENSKILNRRFKKYINFCTEMGFAAPQINGSSNYLVGTINFEKIKIWILNTAWYALNGGEQDKNNLWIGRPFYDFLLNESNASIKPINICINHHPKEWLNENETLTEGINKSLFELIASKNQINFTGHTHGNIQEPNIYNNFMISFTAGATYQSTDYCHNFSIYDLNIDEKTIVRQPWISINGSDWEERPTTEPYVIDNHEADIINSIEDNTQSATTAPEESASALLKKTIAEIDINMIKVTEADFGSNKVMIWPVVPRLMLTTIHLAQLELMKILHQKFGWSIYAIISNCGANPLPTHDTNGFVKKLKTYCQSNGISNLEVEHLTKYFDKDHTLAPQVLDSFTHISSKITLPTLRKIKEKNMIVKRSKK